MNNILIKSLGVIPPVLYKYIEKTVSNSSNCSQIESIRLQRYGQMLLRDFDKEIAKIAKNKKVMVIKEGLYPYDFCSATFLHNMLRNCLYAMYKGCIPYIGINEDAEPDRIRWNWFFKQPCESIWRDYDIEGFNRIECTQKIAPYGPQFDYVNDREKIDFQIWNFLYRKFVVLNEEMQQYCSDEYNCVRASDDGDKKQRKILAVLLRGTDYTATKPKGHPKQPKLEKVLKKVTTECSIEMYTHIYVATEEKRIFNKFVEEFGERRVLSNKRRYYDELYYNSNEKLLSRISFDRANDNYLKGKEYFSSLYIVSRCDGMVAGNCGGTFVSLLLSESQENKYVYNEGFY